MSKIYKGFLFLFSFSIFLFSFNECRAQTSNSDQMPITTSSKNAREKFIKGRDLIESQRRTEALKYFSDAIKEDPNFAIAYLYRAQTQPAPKEAFADLKKANSLSDKVSEAERLQISGLEAGVNGNSMKQKEDYEKLVSLYPKNARALTLLGGYYYGQQNYKKALEEYKKAAEADSKYSPVFNMLGYCNSRLMDYNAAEKAFQKYIQLNPNDPNPYDSYAELLLKEGKYDKSIENYKKALSLDPHFISSVSGVAANEMYKGDYNSSREELKKLFDNARNNGEKRTALNLTAVTYIDEGKPEMALDEIKKEYDMAKKDNDQISMGNDLTNMGTIQLEMNKSKEALVNFQESLKAFENSSLTQKIKENIKLGMLYNESNVAIHENDFKTASEKAKEYMEGVKALNNPNQIRNAHQLYAMIDLAQKKADDCLKELASANNEDPYNLYRMAVAYQMKGNKEKAKEYCEKVINFNTIPGINLAIARNKAKKLLAKL